MYKTIFLGIIIICFESFNLCAEHEVKLMPIQQKDDYDELQGMLNSNSQIVKLTPNRTYNLSKALTIDRIKKIDGNNSAIIFKGKIDSGLLINSNDVSIANLNLDGDNTVNIIKLGVGVKNISLSRLKFTNAKVGVESSKDHTDINISECQFSVNVHGIVLRGINGALIENNSFNGKRASGGTGIYVLGSSTIASSINNGLISLKDNSFRSGDIVRFYGSQSPDGIKNDLNYYVKSSSGKNITVSKSLGEQELKLSQNDPLNCIHVNKNVRILNNTTSNNRCGIYLIRTDSSIVSGNTVSDVTGIQLEESWNNKVLKNRVKDAKDLGINLHKNSSYNTITNNHVTNCGNAALGLTGDITSKIANNNYNVLINNDLSNSKALSSYPQLTGNGIELNQLGSGNIIKNNHIYGNQNYGIRVAKGISNTVILGNTVTGNKFGVNISNDGTDLDSNNISKNYNEGILMGINVSNVRIKRNKLSKNGNYAIRVGSKSKKIEIENNTLDGNGMDISTSNFRDNKIIKNVRPSNEKVK